MPFGQSTPFSTITAATIGFAVGELANYVASEMGANEFGKRTATFIGHTAGSLVAGYAVNAVLGVDVTGAVVTTAQSPTMAAMHVILRNSKAPLLGF